MSNKATGKGNTEAGPSTKVPACDICRRRKVKCDATGVPPCSNCLAAGDDCTFGQAGPKRGRPKGYVESLEKRVAKMEWFLRKDMAKDDFIQEFGPPLKAKHKEPAQKPPPKPATAITAPLPIAMAFTKLTAEIIPSCPPTGSTTTASSSSPANTDRFFKPQELPPRYFGDSSGKTLIESVVAAKSQVSSQGLLDNPGPWAELPWEKLGLEEPPPQYTFPEDDLLRKLVDIYFERFNIILPVLHRPTFLSQLAEGLHHKDEAFGANVLTVCAAAARYSRDPRVFMAEHGNAPHTAGWKWFRQVRLFKDSVLLKPANLFDLQFYPLASAFLSGTSHVQSLWSFIGLGIRRAQDVGADRRSGKPLSVTHELWKRVWWALVVQDRLMASHLGRQPAVKEEDFDQDLPVECDDEYWDHPDPEQAWKQPPNTPSKASCFRYLIAIARLLGMVMRSIYYPNPRRFLIDLFGENWQAHMVTELDSALNVWTERLPDFLRWDPNREPDVFYHQSAMLHTHYHFLQISIHRPLIPLPGRQAKLPTPSLTICTNAARACLQILWAQTRNSGTENTPDGIPWLHSDGLAFIAGVVLVLNLWKGRKEGKAMNLEREMGDVQKSADLLAANDEYTMTARPMRSILAQLASVGELPIPHDSGLQVEAQGFPVPLAGMGAQGHGTGMNGYYDPLLVPDPSSSMAPPLLPQPDMFSTMLPHDPAFFTGQAQARPMAQNPNEFAVFGSLPTYDFGYWEGYLNNFNEIQQMSQDMYMPTQNQPQEQQQL